MKVYRGSAAAARTYVEADRSRADDYYLAEGTGVAELLVASPLDPAHPDATGEGGGEVSPVVRHAGMLDGDAYEAWVAGYDTDGVAKGRLRTDDQGVRFAEVVVNGPKTYSLAAALHPEIAAAYDAAQDRAARTIVGWVAEHATTRIGPRGRQVQVGVEQIEAAVIRHYTSRAGDPHRHLHLQINARVFAAGKWRGIHTVGIRDSLAAINGIGRAAIQCDPEFRAALAAHGYTVDNESGEVRELAPFAGKFSARAAQIGRNVDRYEAQWRTEHPGEEPGPRLRRGWDTRAWAEARPDKVVPTDGHQLARRWVEELHALGFRAPARAVEFVAPKPGKLLRDNIAESVLDRLGARRSAWNEADARGEVEQIIAMAGVIAETPARQEAAEDITRRVMDAGVPLLERDDVPGHVRAFTSPRVLEVEAALTTMLADRAASDVQAYDPEFLSWKFFPKLDPDQRSVVTAIACGGPLTLVEGAAGTGKTTTLRVGVDLVCTLGHETIVVAPTLKAAQVAGEQLRTRAFSAAWLVHQYGYRWNDDGRWERLPHPSTQDPPGLEPPDRRAALRPRDVLVIDEAAMLDQDTACALVEIADETGARIVLVGDRHQLPAVGRGGVLDLAARWARPDSCLTLDAVHRFTDPDYAQLSTRMRTGQHPGEVFDQLYARGEIAIHPSDLERTHALATTAYGGAGGDDVRAVDGGAVLLIADTREQVAQLNAAVRDTRVAAGVVEDRRVLITDAGERVGVGDRVATRANDRALDVANRDTWTVTAINDTGHLTVDGTSGERTLPADYARVHLELAYATTVYGAQGETTDAAHLVLGDHTGAASAYVAMTRGRHGNTAHLVAETIDEARDQWVAAFTRDRADLGPAHAAQVAAEDIDRYGPIAQNKPWPSDTRPATQRHWPEPARRPAPYKSPDRSPRGGISW